MLRLKTYIFLVLVFASSVAYAQKIVVEGYTIDHSTQEPLGYAAISITDSLTGEILYQVATTEDGHFEAKIPLKTEARLYIHASYLGYKPFSQPIANQSQTYTLALQPDLQQIETITILGQAHAIHNERGKTIIKPTNLRNADRMNVAQMLNHLPGVEGEAGIYTLMGQQTLIAINGVDQTMSGEILESFLEALPVDAVEEVELTPLPSSQYDADVDAAIEITLKKDLEDGLMGQVGVHSSFFKEGVSDAGGSGFVLLHKNKITFHSTLDYTRRNLWAKSRGEMYFKLPDAHIEEHNHDTGHKDVFLSSSNLAYSMDNGSVLNTNLFIYTDGGIRDARFSQKNSTASFDRNRNDAHANEGIYSVSVQYNSPQDKPWTWAVQYDGMYTLRKERGNYFREVDSVATTSFREDALRWERSPLQEAGIVEVNNLYSSTRTREMAHSLSADFVNEINDRWSIFYGTSLEYSSVKDRVWEQNFEESEDYTSEFKARELAAKLYTEATWKISDRWAMMGGVRFESIGYKYDQKDDNLLLKKNFTYFCPQLQLLYDADIYHLTISYKQHISRPDYELILPGKRYVNDYFYTEGTPNLRPTRIHRLRINQSLKDKAYLGLYYQRNKSLSGELLMTDEGKQQIVGKVMNYGDQRILGVFANYDYRLFQGKVYGSITGEVKHHKFDALPTGVEILRRTFWQSNIHLNVFYDPTERLSLELSGGYRSRTLGLQSTLSDYWRINMGASYTFLDKSLILRLALSDITSSNHLLSRRILGENYWTTDADRRGITCLVSLTYKFRK